MMLVASCGDDGNVTVRQGEGTISYDGKTYSVDLATIFTSGPDDEGLYQHFVSFVSSETGNFFAFEVTNDSSASDIPAGEYEQAPDGDNSASFSVKPDGTTPVAGRPAGTVTVTKSGEANTFDFEGTDTVASDEPKSVTFTFTGKPVKTSIRQ